MTFDISSPRSASSDPAGVRGDPRVSHRAGSVRNQRLSSPQPERIVPSGTCKTPAERYTNRRVLARTVQPCHSTHYVTLGRSGLRVSPFALGAMTFGEDRGWGSHVAELGAISRPTWTGRQLIDTQFYTNGHSEKILGDWFAAHPGRRDRVVLATKFFRNMFPGDPNGGGAGRRRSSPRSRSPAAHAHRLPGPVLAAQLGSAHALEETLRALDDLVREGKIRYIGFSNTPAWVTAQAQTTAPAARLDAADRAAGRVLAVGPHGRGRTRTAGARPGHGAGAVEPA